MNYSDQNPWEKIMSFLPEKFQFTQDCCPAEEHWDWKGSKVHLDAFRNPDARARIILLHGVGTNGRQMSTIVGRPLALAGYEVVAVDMPLYGVTEVNRQSVISYDDWVQLGSDYVDRSIRRNHLSRGWRTDRGRRRRTRRYRCRGFCRNNL